MMQSKLKKLAVILFVVMLTLFLTATLLPKMLVATGVTTEHEMDRLPKDQTVNGIGLFTGNVVQIDGTVEGTTFASGQDVRVNGTINGDLFVAGQTLTINGQVNGNIFMAGQTVVIGAKTTGDVFVAGQTSSISKEAVMGRDLFVAGQSVTMDGTVQRHLSGGAVTVSIGGTVNQNAVLDADELKLLDGAVINGNLSYKSPNQAILSPNAKVAGVTDWQKTEAATVQPEPEKKAIRPASIILGILWTIVSALVVWLVVKLFRPNFWTVLSNTIAESPWKAIGIGVLALLVMPLLLILLMVTVIGIPLGFLLGMLYVIVMYISKIIVADYAGSWLTKRFGWQERHMGIWPVLLCLAVIAILCRIPYLGFLVRLVVVFAGLGAVVVYLLKKKAPEAAA